MIRPATWSGASFGGGHHLVPFVIQRTGQRVDHPDTAGVELGTHALCERQGRGLAR